jgi:hypothetical protein
MTPTYGRAVEKKKQNIAAFAVLIIVSRKEI